LRDGGCCANCKRKLGLHAHHIRFRSKGGRTVLANELCVCVSCHSLIHAGILKVTGNPIDGITFHTRANELTEEFTEELEEKMAAVPVLIVAPAKKDEAPAGETSPPAVAVDTGRPEPEAQEAAAEQPATQPDTGRPAEKKEAGPPAKGNGSGRPAEEEEEAVEMTEAALRTLGFTRREARERVHGARERLFKAGRSSLTAADCNDLLRG